MKRIALVCCVLFAVCVTAPAWAATVQHQNALLTKLKTDHQTVVAAKEALDSAEQAAGLPETFPEAGQHKPGTPQHLSPAQRLAEMLQHVQKTITRVQALQAKANLPAAVTSAAQQLLTDLNTFENDITQAQAHVGNGNTSTVK